MKKYLIYSLVLIITFALLLTGMGCKTTATADTESESEASETTTEAEDTEPDPEDSVAASETSTATESTTVAEIDSETTVLDEEVTIGLSMNGVNVPYLAVFTSVYEELSDERGVNLLMTDAGWDPIKQANQIDDLISKDVSAIVVVPADAAAIVAPIKKASDAGFIVVSSNYLPNEEGLQYINTYTGPSCWEQAKILAEYAVGNLEEKGKLSDGGFIVEIAGTPGSSAAIDRSGGFATKLAEVAPDIELLASQPSNWLKEEAYSVMQDFIVAYGDKIDGVHVHDDSSAAGAIQAIEESGYVSGEDILVWGYGGSIEGIKNIQAEKQNATIAQPPSFDATLSFETTLKLINGEQVPAFNYMEMPVVDSSNVEEFAPGEW